MGAKVKTMDAAEFEASCLRTIERMCEDREPVALTEGGQPLAVLSPAPRAEKTALIIGIMPGSVLGYDDPFGPAADWSD